jgi:hypothetical protein
LDLLTTSKENVPSPLAIEALGEVFANNLTLASQIPDEIFWHFGRCIENDVGDRIRLIQFFIDVISINGQAVKRNQDLALKVLMHTGFRHVNKSRYWVELPRQKKESIIKTVRERQAAAGGIPLSDIHVGSLKGGRKGVRSFASTVDQKLEQVLDMDELASRPSEVAMGGRERGSEGSIAAAARSTKGTSQQQQQQQQQQSPIVSSIVVEGLKAPSPHHEKMGVYTLLQGRAVNGREVWQRQPSLREIGSGNTATSFLSYSKNGKWGFMTEGDSRGWAKLASDSRTPDKAEGVWQVNLEADARRSSKGVWEDTPQLRVRSASASASAVASTSALSPAEAQPPVSPATAKPAKKGSLWKKALLTNKTARATDDTVEIIVMQLLYHCKLVECLALASKQNIRTQAKLRLILPPETILTTIQDLSKDMGVTELATAYVQFFESVYLDTRIPFEGLVDDPRLEQVTRFMVEEMELYRFRTAPLLQSKGRSGEMGRRSTAGRDSKEFEETSNDLSHLPGLRGGAGDIEMMNRFGTDAEAANMDPMQASEQWRALTRGGSESSFGGSESSFGGSSAGGSSQGGTSMFSSIAETIVFNFADDDEVSRLQAQCLNSIHTLSLSESCLPLSALETQTTRVTISAQPAG